MPEEKKHSCRVLVCPDCGREYRAEKLELLAFNPFPAKKAGRQD